MSVKTTTIGVAFAHAAATVLASGIVIDKSKSDKLSATELANLFHRVLTWEDQMLLFASVGCGALALVIMCVSKLSRDER